jgi:hypothetical protein
MLPIRAAWMVVGDSHSTGIPISRSTSTKGRRQFAEHRLARRPDDLKTVILVAADQKPRSGKAQCTGVNTGAF